MKKIARKLALTRETLQALDSALKLEEIAGGVGTLRCSTTLASCCTVC